MSKRGQVTIFIIMGIIILLAVVALFFIRSYVVKEKITEVARPIEQLPTEMEPLRSFTESCLRSVGEQALIRLGQQGGYIYPDTWDSLSFDEKNPTNSDGLTFPGSELKLPYWWYNQAKNEQNQILLASKRPSLEKMQNDLARFVTLELSACLNHYESFKPTFDITEKDFSTTVSIGPQTVKFLVTHPLTIKKGSATAEINSFYTEIPVKLRHMYEIASLITTTQQNYSFLEQHTMNLIEIFSGPSQNQLPPTADETFNAGSSIFWRKSEVKENFKMVLAGYIPFLRFYGSKNYYAYQFPESAPLRELNQRVYNNMVLPLSGAEDFEVRFQYLDDWDLYFNVNAEGEIIKPASTSINLYLAEFGWQHYRTIYDISYPVFVSLYSPEGLDGLGYQFNFALEANIRDNEGIEAEETFLPLISTFQESLFCREDQKNSGEITVGVLNKYSREPLSQAAVFFSVGEEKCQLGITDENGLLKTKFPLAIGGLLTASKENYLAASQPLDTELGLSDSAELALWPIKAIKVGALKKKLVNCKVKGGQESCFTSNESRMVAENPLAAGLLTQGAAAEWLKVKEEVVKGSSLAQQIRWYFSPTPYPPQETEQVIIIFNRVSENEKSLEAALSVYGSQSQEVNLAPGDYDLTVQTIFHEGLKIPAERREIDDDKFTVNELVFEKLPAGGLKWNNTARLTIKPSDLYSAGKLNLFYLYFGLPDVPEESRMSEDINILSQINNLSLQLKGKLLPVFT